MLFIPSYPNVATMEDTVRSNSIFFFQAEDGIRDRNVTGVQTCALPIYPAAPEQLTTFFCCDKVADILPGGRTLRSASPAHNGTIDLSRRFGTSLSVAPRARSEERRVGKECRFRWQPDDCTKSNEYEDRL